MSGSIYKGYNNSNTPVPEYNVADNVTASQTMYSTLFNIAPMLAAPLDTAGVVFIAGNNYQQLVQSQKSNILVYNILQNYMYSSGTSYHTTSTVLCDVESVWMIFSTDFLQIQSLPVQVTSQGYTIITESANTSLFALQWQGLHMFNNEITSRLLNWKNIPNTTTN